MQLPQDLTLHQTGREEIPLRGEKGEIGVVLAEEVAHGIVNVIVIEND